MCAWAIINAGWYEISASLEIPCESETARVRIIYDFKKKSLINFNPSNKEQKKQNVTQKCIT
jgi:hypothetical protein